MPVIGAGPGARSERDRERQQTREDNTRASFRRAYAPMVVDGPGRPGILARGSSRCIPRLPIRLRGTDVPLRRDSGGRLTQPAWDVAPRIQWRHRVGFVPTSHDRRATERELY